MKSNVANQVTAAFRRSLKMTFDWMITKGEPLKVHSVEELQSCAKNAIDDLFESGDYFINNAGEIKPKGAELPF